MYSKPLLKFDTDEFKPYHVSCLISNYVTSYLNKKYHKRLELDNLLDHIESNIGVKIQSQRLYIG